MDFENGKPFIIATKLVCQRVLGLEIFPQPPIVLNTYAPKHFVTGALRVHGDHNATIAFGIDRVFALRATQLLMRHKANGVDPTVVDVVGELTNQIAGAARQRMGRTNMSVSFPQVICGVSKLLPCPPGAYRVSYPFSSLWGNISVDFAIQKTEEEKKKLEEQKNQMWVN